MILKLARLFSVLVAVGFIAASALYGYSGGTWKVFLDAKAALTQRPLPPLKIVVDAVVPGAALNEHLLLIFGMNALSVFAVFAALPTSIVASGVSRSAAFASFIANSFVVASHVLMFFRGAVVPADEKDFYIEHAIPFAVLVVSSLLILLFGDRSSSSASASSSSANTVSLFVKLLRLPMALNAVVSILIALATFVFNPDLKQFYELQRSKLGIDQHAIDPLIHENEFAYFLALQVQAIEIGAFALALVAALTSSRRLSFQLVAINVLVQASWLFSSALAVGTARGNGASPEALAVLENNAKLAVAPLLMTLLPFVWFVLTTDDEIHQPQQAHNTHKKTQ